VHPFTRRDPGDWGQTGRVRSPYRGRTENTENRCYAADMPARGQTFEHIAARLKSDS